MNSGSEWFSERIKVWNKCLGLGFVDWLYKLEKYQWKFTVYMTHTFKEMQVIILIYRHIFCVDSGNNIVEDWKQ